ncbi:GNAT family N-acetyltransferase [Halopiger aswanensis]|uniref:Acetyltransferase (GNAT) family protein n=1 Tax=Halopiger aswanensis TaxID=148449 RepID=A0A3R7FVX0_9EURY|nr:GNAT family N-acetyltransferase [Halopiger aswanensis]RKD95313.1 acetyltransferase (GNAT) family protein [Halopiger aswanensis]
MAAAQRTSLPRPPKTFTDREERRISIHEYDGELGPLQEMYAHFGDDSRTQGLPPRSEDRTVEWLSELLEEGLNVVARHEGDVVGHAVLIPYDSTSELAIFVRPAYQSAGIGTHLIGCLLGHGQANGLTHVWLTVARTNRIAMNLYRSAGFEITERDRGEYEMEREL